MQPNILNSAVYLKVKISLNSSKREKPIFFHFTQNNLVIYSHWCIIRPLYIESFKNFLVWIWFFWVFFELPCQRKLNFIKKWRQSTTYNKLEWVHPPLSTIQKHELIVRSLKGVHTKLKRIGSWIQLHHSSISLPLLVHYHQTSGGVGRDASYKRYLIINQQYLSNHPSLLCNSNN